MDTSAPLPEGSSLHLDPRDLSSRCQTWSDCSPRSNTPFATLSDGRLKSSYSRVGHQGLDQWGRSKGVLGSQHAEHYLLSNNGQWYMSTTTRDYRPTSLAAGYVELERVDHRHGRRVEKSKSWVGVVLRGEWLNDGSKTTSGFIA